MLQSEFFERTGVQVSVDEYAAIEVCYYNFPGDKDEFCAAWCKMNAKRVKAAKDERKVAERMKKQNARLLILMNRMDNKRRALRDDYSSMPVSVEFLSQRDQAFLEGLGFRMRLTDEEAYYSYGYNRFKRIDETAYEIRKYLKIA